MYVTPPHAVGHLTQPLAAAAEADPRSEGRMLRALKGDEPASISAAVELIERTRESTDPLGQSVDTFA